MHTCTTSRFSQIHSFHGLNNCIIFKNMHFETRLHFQSSKRPKHKKFSLFVKSPPHRIWFACGFGARRTHSRCSFRSSEAVSLEINLTRSGRKRRAQLFLCSRERERERVRLILITPNWIPIKSAGNWVPALFWKKRKASTQGCSAPLYEAR